MIKEVETVSLPFICGHRSTRAGTVGDALVGDVGGWNRRKTILTASLAAAAGLASLSKPLNLPWLIAAGLFVATAGAVAILVISSEQVRLEGKRERAELDRRVKVPMAPITEIDPTQIGVDPAAIQTELGGTVPQYVGREVDAELREGDRSGAYRRPLDAGGSRGVESRQVPNSVSRAFARAPWRAITVGRSGGRRCAALAARPGTGDGNPAEYAVLWLDDLEPFLAQGVTLQILQEWQSRRPGWIVAATYGGKGSELVAEAATGGLKTLADDILQRARRSRCTPRVARKWIRCVGGSRMPTWTDAQSWAGRIPRGRPSAAAQAHQQAARTRGARMPEGVAVVRAAIDWARCGRTDPISHDTLRALWPAFLQAGVTPSEERLAIGLEWALRPVAATIALLQADHGYLAYDYAVRLVREQPTLNHPAPQSGMLRSAPPPPTKPTQSQ